MPRTHRAPLTLIVLSIPLGACSSLFGIHMADRASRAVPASQVSVASVTAPKTMLGRQQLSNGQVGTAIETFQQALADGEDRAPALNGLGVAYARLGRPDIALRYFEEATAIAPADPRYAQNLALLLNSQTERAKPALATSLPAQQAEPARGALQRVSANEFHIAIADLQPAPVPGATVTVAMQGRATASSPLARPASTAPSSAVRASAAAQRPTIVRVAASGANLQRVSRGEVHIASNGAKAPLSERTAASLNGRFHPSVRIALADVPSRHPAAFVRIVLPEVQPANMP